MISLLAALSFLVEGAVLDWSALLLVGERLLSGARRFRIHVLLNRDDGQPIDRRPNCDSVRKSHGPYDKWRDSISWLMSAPHFAGRTHRVGKLHPYRSWGREHCAHSLQACGYSAGDA